MLEPTKEISPWQITFLIMTMLTAYTLLTHFNLIGYKYQLDESATILTIEEGFYMKEIYNVQVTNENTIQVLQEVMLPVNSANRIWQLDTIIMSLFFGGFVALTQLPATRMKNIKWYVILYVVSVIVFILWNIYAHKELLVEIGSFYKMDL